MFLSALILIGNSKNYKSLHQSHYVHPYGKLALTTKEFVQDQAIALEQLSHRRVWEVLWNTELMLRWNRLGQKQVVCPKYRQSFVLHLLLLPLLWFPVVHWQAHLRRHHQVPQRTCYKCTEPSEFSQGAWLFTILGVNLISELCKAGGGNVKLDSDTK